jgi:hypothetical protein
LRRGVARASLRVGVVKGAWVEAKVMRPCPSCMTKYEPFKYFKTRRDISPLAVMMHLRFPLSLRNVEDLLHERGIDISHDAVRYSWPRFRPLSAAEI